MTAATTRRTKERSPKALALPYLLEWKEAESIDCVAQGVITNKTAHHVWISCTKWIARGILRLEAATGTNPERPVGLTLEA